jgi:hypothetical protein
MLENVGGRSIEGKYLRTGAKPVRLWVLLRTGGTFPCTPSSSTNDNSTTAILLVEFGKYETSIVIGFRIVDI